MVPHFHNWIKVDFYRKCKVSRHYHYLHINKILRNMYLMSSRGTIHLRRRQIFAIFYPPRLFSMECYPGNLKNTRLHSYFRNCRSPLKNADVLNEWSQSIILCQHVNLIRGWTSATMLHKSLNLWCLKFDN